MASIEKPKLYGVEKKIIEVEHHEAEAFRSQWLVGDRPATFEVAMAYVVNEVRYRTDLKRHGVMVKL